MGLLGVRNSSSNELPRNAPAAASPSLPFASFSATRRYYPRQDPSALIAPAGPSRETTDEVDRRGLAELAASVYLVDLLLNPDVGSSLALKAERCRITTFRQAADRAGQQANSNGHRAISH